MIKISDALQAIIDKNSLLRFGMANHLLNLTQLAKFISPLVSARAKKEVSLSALIMGLSRLQKRLDKIAPKTSLFHFKNMVIHSDLCTITFENTNEVHRQINRAYQLIKKKNGYITVTEGANEITLIFDQRFADEIRTLFPAPPKNDRRGIASIGIQFDEKYIKIPGFLYSVMQQIAIQGINLEEVASTYTEFILYVDKKDARLAFDTLFNCFMCARL